MVHGDDSRNIEPCLYITTLAQDELILATQTAFTTAAESIRQVDPASVITMISDEPCPPNCRPMISMVLEGAVPLERLSIRPADFYEGLKIVPVLGQRVSAIDPGNRSVSVDGRT